MASRKVSFGRRMKWSPATEKKPSATGAITADRRVAVDARARAVAVRKDRLLVEFMDGRTIAVPLDRFPRLIEASPRERENYQLIGDGTLIYWPDVDEDIDVANLLVR